MIEAREKSSRGDQFGVSPGKSMDVVAGSIIGVLSGTHTVPVRDCAVQCVGDRTRSPLGEKCVFDITLGHRTYPPWV
jgi:hypothetical protein